MTTQASSGNIHSQDIYAQTVNTGYIEQRTELTVNLILGQLDSLASLLAGGDVAFRVTKGQMTAHAQDKTLPLPRNLLEGINLLRQAVDIRPSTRYRAYAAWLVTRRAQSPIQHVAARERYIRLGGHLERERPRLKTAFTGWYPQPNGPPASRKLEDVTEALTEHSAFVLLGAPGSGKSTVLHRLEQDMAGRYLAERDRRLPLLLTLSDYRWRQDDPFTFISRQWEQNVGTPLLDMLRAGQVLLLLDGLNEMSRLEAYADRRQRANDWQYFLQRHFADPHLGSRAIVY